MTRDEAKVLDSQIRQNCEANGYSVNWWADSGQVVMKRNGQVKLSYSVRDDDKVDVVRKSINDALTGFVFKIRVTDMMGYYHPEIRMTAVITPLS